MANPDWVHVPDCNDWGFERTYLNDECLICLLIISVRQDERRKCNEERADIPIQGEHDPLCFPAIRDVRIGDWGASCFTCQVISMARQQGRADEREAAAKRVEALRRTRSPWTLALEWLLDAAIAAVRDEGNTG